jgi:hypothetical protein
MKSYLARPALALAVSLALASCGGGGKETYPVNVTVFNVQFDGLVLTTNGMEVAVPVPAKAGDSVVVTFPNGLDYGTYYNVVPKGGTATSRTGSQPLHQTCVTNGLPQEYGTAGQKASVASARTPAIEVSYTCALNVLPLSGKVVGLTSGTVTLINGSDASIPVTGVTTSNEIPFALKPVPFGSTYGVSVLTQPDNFTCTVANASGEMNVITEKAGGATNVLVTCVPKAP